MAKSLRKSGPLVQLDDFLIRAKELEYFQGAGETLYEVIGSEEDELIFVAVKGKRKLQGIDLREVYNAYVELNEFTSNKIGRYVAPRNFAVAKGLLLQCKMLVYSPAQ